MGRDKALLIMDANVLIDLCEADRTLIRLISQHVGPIHVPLPVLQEVDQIDEAQCADLGNHAGRAIAADSDRRGNPSPSRSFVQRPPLPS